MSNGRDDEVDMGRALIDDAAAERLLGGLVTPEDAPPGYAGVAALVQAATGPALPRELAGQAAVISACAAAVLCALEQTPTRQRRPMFARLLSAKVAAVAAATVLGATAAAAATGGLPPQAQTAVSAAASHVGISIPSGAGTGATTVSASDKPEGATSRPGQAGAGAGPDAHADFGLCTAFLAGPGDGGATSTTDTSTTSAKASSAAFSRLIGAHGGTAASTTAYCKGIIGAHQAAHPGADAPDQTGDAPGAGHAHPPASTPNTGGTGTAGQASGGSDAHGATASGGASGGEPSHQANRGNGAGNEHRP